MNQSYNGEGALKTRTRSDTIHPPPHLFYESLRMTMIIVSAIDCQGLGETASQVAPQIVLSVR